MSDWPFRVNFDQTNIVPVPVGWSTVTDARVLVLGALFLNSTTKPLQITIADGAGRIACGPYEILPGLVGSIDVGLGGGLPPGLILKGVQWRASGEGIAGDIHRITVEDQDKDPAAVSLGRRGGSARSKSKVAAARKNGKKGGRPAKAQS